MRKSPEQRDAHSDLHLPFRPVRHDAGAQPRPEHGRRDHRKQRQHVDRNERHVGEGFDDRRQRVAGVQRAWNDAVRHHPDGAEYGRRDSEGPDAKRIEEVRQEADAQLCRGRHARVRCGRGRRPLAADLGDRPAPAADVDGRECAKRREQSDNGIH
jgi:hypothetical protein